MGLVGDRERERAAALLQGHYVRGRLTVEEFAERLEVALTARRESDVRVALGELPGAGRERFPGAWSGLEAIWRAGGRAAFVLAVWSLWWIASLVLLLGFVVSVLVQGVSLTNGVTFAGLWLVCTLVARGVVRRRRRAWA